MSDFTLSDLERIIAERAKSGDSDSWTAKLVEQGLPRASQKLGEEATETLIAALQGDKKELCEESADLLYHLLVVLYICDVRLEDVMSVLSSRNSLGN